jgi:hypothetical protein
MKKRIYTGIILGIVAGLIDIVPMIFQDLPLNACLSAFSMWTMTGLFMGLTRFQLTGMGKGLLISFCMLIPSLFIIGWADPYSFLPIITMTALLGALIGLIFQKIIKE